MNIITQVSDLDGNGLKGQKHQAQGVASLALGLVLLAFQAVPVQIRNLSIIIFALTQHFEMLS